MDARNRREHDEAHHRTTRYKRCCAGCPIRVCEGDLPSRSPTHPDAAGARWWSPRAQHPCRREHRVGIGRLPDRRLLGRGAPRRRVHVVRGLRCHVSEPAVPELWWKPDVATHSSGGITRAEPGVDGTGVQPGVSVEILGRLASDGSISCQSGSHRVCSCCSKRARLKQLLQSRSSETVTDRR